MTVAESPGRADGIASFRRHVDGLYFGYGGWGATRTFATARVDGLPSAGGVFLSPLSICFYEGFIVREVLFDQLLVCLTTTVHCVFVWQLQFAE
jgi:hypothetical protein